MSAGGAGSGSASGGGAAAATPLTPDELEAALRAIGESQYHDKHPFNVRMHEGTLTRRELQLWAANRYYYQTRIPLKDGAILTKAGDPEFRREWVQRIRDHDGDRPGEGGLALWLRMAELLGCERGEVERLEAVLPGVRRACDAYVDLVETSDLLTSVAASLTELFAGDIMKTRIDAFERHYPWLDEEGLAYFRTRTRQAPRDAAWGLEFVREHARSAEEQERCLEALRTKCRILWSLLDAVECAAGRPRLAANALVRERTAEGGAGEETVVVLAERAVKVGGSGREILALCDGRRSGEEVARELARRHASASDPGDPADPANATSPDARRIANDAHEFIEAMVRQGVLTLDRAGAA